MIRLGLLVLPFRILWRIVTRMEEARRRRFFKAATCQQIRWAVDVASRHIPSATCLTQALSAKVIFGKYGYDADLKIGVAKDAESNLAAHAWLEIGGKIVIGNLPDLNRYVCLPPLAVKIR